MPVGIVNSIICKATELNCGLGCSNVNNGLGNANWNIVAGAYNEKKYSNALSSNIVIRYCNI